MNSQNSDSGLELRAIRDAMIASAINVCAVSVENGLLLSSYNAVEPKEEITLKMTKKGTELAPRYVAVILHQCCCNQFVIRGSCMLYSHLYRVTSYNRVDKRIYEVSAKYVHSVKLDVKVKDGIDVVPEEVLEIIQIVENEYYAPTEVKLNRAIILFGKRDNNYVLNVAGMWWRGGSPSYLETVETVIARKIEER